MSSLYAIRAFCQTLKAINIEKNANKATKNYNYIADKHTINKKSKFQKIEISKIYFLTPFSTLCPAFIYFQVLYKWVYGTLSSKNFVCAAFNVDTSLFADEAALDRAKLYIHSMNSTSLPLPQLLNADCPKPGKICLYFLLKF